MDDLEEDYKIFKMKRLEKIIDVIIIITIYNLFIYQMKKKSPLDI